MAKSKPTPDALQTLRNTHDTKKQDFSVAAIYANVRYQCRVEVVPGQSLATNPDHVRKFVDTIQDGEATYPVVLFHDKKMDKYILADGFHRYTAHKKLGKASIPAFVFEVEDSDREAFLFSMEANLQHTQLAVTVADKINGYRRYLEDPEHWKWSDNAIARKCKLSGGTGTKIRARFCEERGIVMPTEGLVFKNGVSRLVKKPNSPGLPPIRMGATTSSGGRQPNCTYRGKTLFLPCSKDGIQTPEMEAARATFVAKVDAEFAATLESKWPMTHEDLKGWLVRRGVATSSKNVAGLNFVILVSGADAIRILKVATPDAILAEVKRLDLYEMGGGTVSRRIIVGYTKKAKGTNSQLMSVLSALGYTFMTPEELVDDLLAKQADTSQSAG